MTRRELLEWEGAWWLPVLWLEPAAVDDDEFDHDELARATLEHLCAPMDGQGMLSELLARGGLEAAQTWMERAAGAGVLGSDALASLQKKIARSGGETPEGAPPERALLDAHALVAEAGDDAPRAAKEALYARDAEAARWIVMRLRDSALARPEWRPPWPWRHADTATVLRWFRDEEPAPSGFAYRWRPAREDAEAEYLIDAIQRWMERPDHDAAADLASAIHRVLGAEVGLGGVELEHHPGLGFMGPMPRINEPGWAGGEEGALLLATQAVSPPAEVGGIWFHATETVPLPPGWLQLSAADLLQACGDAANRRLHVLRALGRMAALHPVSAPTRTPIGRESALSELRRPDLPTQVLVASPGMGVTSVLKRHAVEMEQAGWPVLWHDGSPDDPPDALAAPLAAFHRERRVPTAHEMSAWLSRVGVPKLLIVLDRADLLPGATASELARLLDELVRRGRGSLRAVVGMRASSRPWPGTGRATILPPLDPPVTRELWARLTELSGLRDGNGTADLAAYRSGGHPGLLRDLLKATSRFRADPTATLARSLDLAWSHRDFVTAAVHGVLGELSTSNQHRAALAAALLDAEPVEGSTALVLQPRAIAEWMEAYGWPVDRGAVEALLDDLSRTAFVHLRDGVWSVESDGRLALVRRAMGGLAGWLTP